MVISLAAILSVSRSALVGLAIGVLAFLPVLPRRLIAAFVCAGGVLAVSVFVGVPGLAGTVRGLFLGLEGDPSTLSRTQSRQIALELLSHRFGTGKGFGTFLPRYQIVDNQILGVTVELGLVGLAAFLGLVATAMVQAQSARRRSQGYDAYMAQSLTAALAATVVLFLFFDALSFTQAAGTFFFLIGLSGASRRLLPDTNEIAGDCPQSSAVDGDMTRV
jgi:O-antigen ligase